MHILNQFKRNIHQTRSETNPKIDYIQKLSIECDEFDKSLIFYLQNRLSGLLTPLDQSYRVNYDGIQNQKIVIIQL